MNLEGGEKPFTIFPAQLSGAECLRLIDLFAADPRKRPGRIIRSADEPSELPEVRKCEELVVFASEQKFRFAFTKLQAAVNSLRSDLFPLQALAIMKYEVGDFYDWHTDQGPGQAQFRKISLICALSPAADFAGGELEFASSQLSQWQPRQGDLILFATHLAHRVNPVTHGQRYALVAWALDA